MEFETKEGADKAVEQSEQYNHDGETITVNALPAHQMVCFVLCSYAVERLFKKKMCRLRSSHGEMYDSLCTVLVVDVKNWEPCCAAVL